MNHVKLLRYERGLSQSAVAEGAGIARQTLVTIENGSEPSAPVAKALADFYKVSVERILGLDEVAAA